MKNNISLFFLLSTSAYIFFAPIFAGFDIAIFKKISIGLMLLTLITVIIQNNINKLKRNDFVLLLWIFLLIFVYLSVWDNYKELNLILSILIGYFISKDNERFKVILIIILIIQFGLVFYEFTSGEYIYDKVVLGIDADNESKINISSYGDVGFRPKGLFYGTLEASSFSIMLSMIFRKNLLLLFSILSMAVMVNGRLAIIIVFGIFIVAVYNKILRANISKYLKLSLMYFPVILVFSLLYIYISLLPAEAINNLLNVTNMESSSNSVRILYSLQGFQEFLNYDLKYLLFGNSDAFNLEYGHSAESGWVNELLNIGIVGFTIYFTTIMILMYKSIKGKHYFLFFTVLCIFIALTIYRFETGYLRGVLLWFYIFSTFAYLKNKRIEKYADFNN